MTFVVMKCQFIHNYSMSSEGAKGGLASAALTEREEERRRAHFRGPKFGTSSPAAVNP